MRKKHKHQSKFTFLQAVTYCILIIFIFIGGYWSGYHQVHKRFPYWPQRQQSREDRIQTLQNDIESLQQTLEEKELSLILLQKSQTQE